MTTLTNPPVARVLRPDVQAPPEDLRQRRLRQLKRFGTFSMAYHTLQPGMRYFDSPLGHIAYGRKWGFNFVLGDPLAHPDDHEALLHEYLDRYPRTCFCQVSRPVAEFLAAQGFMVNEFGTEFHLPLDEYTFSGRKKRHIKEAANRIRNQGLVVREMTAAEVDFGQLQRISEHWRQLKHVDSGEMNFLCRPLVLDDEMDVRKFYLVGPDGILAYIHFDPIYRDGRVVGYMSNTKRHLPDVPRDHDFGMTKYIIETFQSEGMETLAFGMAPLYKVEDAEFKSNQLTGRFFRWLYNRPRQRVFNFRGIAEHKRRYRGVESKVYFASKARSNAIRLVALMRHCRIF